MEIEKEISQFCCCPQAELVDCQLTSNICFFMGARQELIYEGMCPKCLTKIKSIFYFVREPDAKIKESQIED